jgi:hypothetical protein
LYFSQIWLNLPVELSHFGYITQLRRGKGEVVGRWQKLFCWFFFVSCVQQSSNGKAWTTRRAIGAAPYLSCRKRQGKKKACTTKWVPVPKKQQQ